MKTDTKTLIKEVRSHAFHLLELGCYDEESNFLTEAADRLEQFAGLKIRHADCDLDRVTVKLNPDGINLGQTLGDLIDLRKKQTTP